MAFARPSTDSDCRLLAPRLREEDVAEVRAANGFTPLTALTMGWLHSSPCLSIVHDGLVIGMFGVAPSDDPLVGHVWLLASPELPSIKSEFIAQTPFISPSSTRSTPSCPTSWMSATRSTSAGCNGSGSPSSTGIHSPGLNSALSWSS